MESILEKLTKERGAYRLSGTAANKLTKECLQMALVCLMGEKPYEKITISEIVRRSGVSRQSFYRNYDSKEDILTDMKNLIASEIEKIIRRIHEQELGSNFYKAIFTFIKENAESIRLVDKAFLNQKQGSILISIVGDLFEIRNKAEYYQLKAYEGGINAVLMEWFRSGMQEDVGEMAQICEELFGKLRQKLAVSTGPAIS